MVSQKVLCQYKNNGNEDLLQHQNAQTIVMPLSKNIYSKVCFEAKIVEQTSGSNAKFSKSSLALESTCLKKKSYFEQTPCFNKEQNTKMNK